MEAICTIRSSTKSGHNHRDRTGEKGIGFKSVFKIADVVWISSREYAFKFDKNADFGIIAPIWEQFPRPVLEKHTSYLLQLDKSYNENQIIDSLEDFDHTYLLFLRRLRHVTLKITTNGKLQTIEVRRRDEVHENGSVTIIEMGEQEFTYMTVRKVVDKLPEEAKRVGVRSSELVLAFPVQGATDDSGMVSGEDQKTTPAGSEGQRENVLEEKPERTPEQAPEDTPFKGTSFKGQNVHAILPISQCSLKVNLLQTFQGRNLLTVPVHCSRRLSPYSQQETHRYIFTIEHCPPRCLPGCFHSQHYPSQFWQHEILVAWLHSIE